MEKTENNQGVPPPPTGSPDNRDPDSPKWVTFHDLMDDAMEGGKLFPMKRRTSTAGAFCSSSGRSASVSSNSSCELENGSASISRPRPSRQSRLDFSQSFGFGEQDQEQIQFHRKPERSQTMSSLFTTTQETSSSPLTTTSTKLTSATSTGSSVFDSSANSSDPYSPLRPLEKNKVHKGWSGKLLSENGMGWSDEVLGFGSSTDEDGDPENENHDQVQDPDRDRRSSNFLRPSSLGFTECVEEPWYTGQNSGLRKISWDRSPSRSFVRNFP